MLAIISPAKDMKVVPGKFTGVDQVSLPWFLNHSEKLVNVLRQFSPDDLETLMGISPKLSALNVNRFAHWDLNHTELNVSLNCLLYILASDG